MPLREKQGLLKTLIGLAARLPWWLGLALALVSYVALHILAQKPVPAAMQPGQMGSFLLANLTQLLARVGQYALPFFFGVSALVSAFRRGKAERLYAAAARRPDAIRQMSWQDFEILVGEYFRRQGFSVTDNGGGFPEEMMARIFEPYVTTKPRGTGLGLAIVKKIVDEHHGEIAIENRPTQGASVTILFPLSDGGTSAKAA